MFLPLRTAIITFWILLQVIAPLVHAHTGQKIFDRGLHIPGLEAYDTLETSDAALLQLSPHHANSEGMVIDIHTGLKAKPTQPTDDGSPLVYIAPDAIQIQTRLSVFDSNFSPPITSAIVQLFARSHSARAPPYLHLL